MENFDYYLAKNLYHEIDGMDGDLDTVSSFGNDIVIYDPQDTFLSFFMTVMKELHNILLKKYWKNMIKQIFLEKF